MIYDTGMGLGEAALCLNIAPPLAINGRGSSELCGEKLALLTGASVWETLLPVVFSVQALLLWVSLSPFLRCGFQETTEHAAAAFPFPSSELGKLLPAGIPDRTNQGIPPKVCLSLGTARIPPHPLPFLLPLPTPVSLPFASFSFLLCLTFEGGGSHIPGWP